MKKALPIVLSCLFFGALIVSAINGELSNYSSTAYEANPVVVKTAGARLWAIEGYNSLGSNQWVQIFNQTASPTNGTVPFRSFLAISGRNFSWTFPDPGLPMGTGLAVANSVSGPTLTIGGTNCLFYVLYQ